MVDVLQRKDQIAAARARLEERGISALGLDLAPHGLWQRLARRTAKLGDYVKSWDVLKTVEFVEERFPKSARVLDLGAYCSEVLAVLHNLGYQRLTGIDLNPALRSMPFADNIRFEIGDFLESRFQDGSFDVITSISVIEHGLDAPRLLREMGRLLVTGGCFTASVDYWPEKIDTRDTKFFGMDWRIFSREEVGEFLRQAAAFGFSPEGPVALDAADRTVAAAGRDYTFAWIALRKG